MKIFISKHFWNASIQDQVVAGIIVVLIVTALTYVIKKIVTVFRKNHRVVPIGIGGQGGNAFVGGSGTAIGGSGGRSGIGGSGGDGGAGIVNGDGLAIGGEGGDAGQINGSNRGGRSGIEASGLPDQQLPDGSWIHDHGRGGRGASSNGSFGIPPNKQSFYKDIINKITTFPKQHGYYLVDYQKLFDENNEHDFFEFIHAVEDCIERDLLKSPKKSEIRIMKKNGEFSYRTYIQIRLRPETDEFLRSENPGTHD